VARMRTVKPALRTSEVVARWRFEVRYFWVLLWGYLDDKGRGLDIPKTIAGDCFPLDDKITATVINGWLRQMATTKVEPDHDPPLCRYEVAGRRYIHSVYWDEHQHPSRPSPSMHPPCPRHEPLTEPGHDSYTETFTEPLTEPPLSPQMLYLESLKGREFEGARREPGSELPGTTADPEPPLTCPEHRDDPDPPACRRCKTARQRHEAWAADKRARIAVAPQCPHHPGEVAHNCRLCRAERLGAA